MSRFQQVRGQSQLSLSRGARDRSELGVLLAHASAAPDSLTERYVFTLAETQVPV